MKKRTVITLGILGALAAAGVSYAWHQVSYSHGSAAEEKNFRVNPGENFLEVAEKLEAQGLVASKWYFAFYAWKEDMRQKIQAGDYVLAGGMTVPEMARVLAQGDAASRSVTVTFPEGWDSRKMAERLTANGLPGREFLEMANRPDPEWRERFVFLRSAPPNASLEGFLFPDTYAFAKDASAEDIVARMLKGFEAKVSEEVVADASGKGRNLFQAVTLASIVENEVQTSEDRRKVADLFWRRLAIGQPLQSDATVKYVLGKNKIQHSVEETRTDSPYNTYVHKGLPPGPIANPGLDALRAAVYPASNPYYYFLSDPKTGETVFAETFEQHKLNKERHGL
jgi:UPF0755 protein